MSAVQMVRHTIQVLVAAYVLVIVIANTSSAAWAANLHTICPFGGVANLYTYFTTGGYVAKLHSAVFIMLLALLIGLVLTGKSFCGWICPLGSIQEGLNGIGRRLWPRLYNRVPRSVERVLHYMKFLVLAWVLVQTARTAHLVFQDWDPYYNLFRIWTDEIAWSGYLVVGLTIVAALFIPRPFSRYACPLGAINGLFNSFSLLGIKRESDGCNQCGVCRNVCPVNIDPCATTSVRSLECTRCMKCVEACPANARSGGTLTIGTWFHRARPGTTDARSRAKIWAFAGVAVAAFALPIIITNITGDFGITKDRVYLTTNDIKGSTSLDDIVGNYGITHQQLYNGLGIPEDVSSSTQLKDLQEEMGIESTGEELISPSLLRSIVDAITLPLSDVAAGLGIADDQLAEVLSAAQLPPTATLGDLLAAGPSGLGLQLLTGGEAAPIGAGDTGTIETETSEPESQEIKGRTTLGQIRDMTTDFQAFLDEFGISGDEPDASTLSELSQKYGFEMSAVRTYLGSPSD